MGGNYNAVIQRQKQSHGALRVLQALVRSDKRRYPATEYQGGNVGLRRESGKSLPEDRVQAKSVLDLQGLRLQGLR